MKQNETLTQVADRIELKAKEAWKELTLSTKARQNNIEVTMEAVNVIYKTRTIQLGVYGIRWCDLAKEKTYNENFKGATWVVVNVPENIWVSEIDLKEWIKNRLIRAGAIVQLCLEGDLYSSEGSLDNIEI